MLPPRSPRPAHPDPLATMQRRRILVTLVALLPIVTVGAQQTHDIAPYLMPNVGQEIALARTAAPSRISDSATVLVLTRARFITAAHGTNGFTCVVLRSFSGTVGNPEYWNPRVRAPHCFNAPASRTVLPEILQEAEWVLAGVSPTETETRSRRRYAAHQIPAPATGAMTYMLSKEQYLQDANPHAAPHLMFYYDKAMPASIWGAVGGMAPVIDDAEGDAHANILTLFVPTRSWSDGSPASSAASRK